MWNVLNIYTYSNWFSVWGCSHVSLILIKDSPDLKYPALAIAYEWHQFSRPDHATQEHYFRMWVSQGKDQDQKLLRDPNKLGTWWYPAPSSAALRGCLGVDRNPAYPVFKRPERLPLTQRRRSHKLHWLVMLVFSVRFLVTLHLRTCIRVGEKETNRNFSSGCLG